MMRSREYAHLWLTLLLPLALLLGKPGITSPVPAFALVYGGLLACLTAYLWDGGKNLNPGPVWATALLLWCGISATTSVASFHSKVQLASLCAGVGVLTSLSLTAAGRKRWRAAALILLVGSVLSAGAGWATLFGAEHFGRLSANWTNPDCFSVIPLCGVFLAGSLLGESRGLTRAALTAAGGFLLVTLVLTWSRSAWAGLVVGVVLVIFRAIRRGEGGVKESLFYAVCAVLPVSVFLFFSGYWRILWERWSKIWTSPTDLPVRAEILVGSLKAFTVHPVSGSGPGTFPLMYQQFRPLESSTTEYINVAHNDLLQMLVETGLPGAVLWLLLLLQAARRCMTCTAPGRRAHSTWMLGATTAVFIYSLFNFAVPVPADLVWWFALLGLAYALPSDQDDWRDYRDSVGVAVSVVLVIAGTLTTVYAARVAVAQSESRQARTELDNLQWREAYQSFSRAVRSVPDNVAYRRERASLSRNLFALTGEKRWLEQADRDLAEARRASPRDLPTLSASYRYYLSQRQFEEAAQVVLLARHYAPSERKYVRYLAGLKALNQELGAAVETLVKEENLDTKRETATLLYLFCREDPAGFLNLLESLEQPRRETLSDQVLREAELQGHQEVLDTVYNWRLSRADKKEKIPILLRWSRSAELTGRPERSEEILEGALGAAGPEHPLYGELLSRWALYQGEEATTVLKDYLNDNPDNSRVRAALARKLPTTEAVDLLETGLKEWPGDPALLEEMGNTYARDGLTQIANDYYQQALDHGGDKEILEKRLKE